MDLIHKEAYLRFRALNRSEDGTVRMMIQAQDRGDLPPPKIDPTQIKTLTPMWESEYQQLHTHHTLSLPDIDPRQDLQHAITTRQTIREQLQTLHQEMQSSADPQRWMYEAYERLYKQDLELSKDIERLDNKIRKHESERVDGAQQEHWYQRRSILYQELQRQYQGYGSVYEFLCTALAEARVKLEQAQQSGRELSTDEFAKLIQTQTTIINQLQKYTETMKNQTVPQEVQEVAQSIMRCVEQEVASENPHLWQRVVKAVRQHVEGA